MVSQLAHQGNGALAKSDHTLHRAAQRTYVIGGHLIDSLCPSPVNGSMNSSLVELFAVKIPPNSSAEKQRELCFEAIVLACHQGQWDKINKVRDLLIGFRVRDNQTIFDALIEKGGEVVIKSVLENGLHEILADGQFKEALHYAVYMGREDLLPVLCRYIPVNQIDSQGKGITPLHISIASGKAETVRALLKLEADPTIRLVSPEGYSFTAFSLAIAKGEVDCFQVLATSSKISWTESVDRIGNFLQVAMHFGQLDMLYCLFTDYISKVTPLLKEISGKKISDVEDAQFVRVAENFGKMCRFLNEGQNENAKAQAEQAIKIWKVKVGGSDAFFALLLYCLGRCYFIQKMYGKAETQFRESLKIFRNIYGENHPFVALNLDHIGMYYLIHRNFKEAIKTLESSLKILKELKLPNEDVAFCLFPLGGCYFADGKYEEARSKLEEAVRILGENRPLTKVKIYHFLGRCYVNLENLQKAKENFQQAYLLAEKVLGENHPDTQKYKNRMLNPKEKFDWKKFILDFAWELISR
jgi:tetratricopeptide (TPR) repeat protein